VRRGASWTAAYHLQLTVAAVARPVRSSVVPSESLLPSGPGCCSPRRRLPGGASCRHPAGGRRRRGRQCQDASHGVGRRSASTMRCPPTRFVVRDPAVQPVRCSARPVSGHLGSSSGVRRSTRPASSSLSGVHPSGVHPSGVQPVWCPPPSVRTRPSPPTSGSGVGDQAGAAGHPSPQEPVEVLVGCRAVERLGGRPSRPWGRATLPGSRVGQWGVAGGLAGLGAAAAYPLSDQAGQAGVRSAAGWRHGVAAPAGWLPLLGWVGDHGAWSSWSLPPGRTGPGRADGRAGGDGRAAPTRPRLAAGVPGSLPTAF
jgi:hypothetical protein